MVSLVLELVRSLSFGALFANAILLLVFKYHPNYFPAGVGYKEVVAVGTIVGTVLHRALNNALFNPATKALAQSAFFYVKLSELHLAYKIGLITRKEYFGFTHRIKLAYFGKPDLDISKVSVAVPPATPRRPKSRARTPELMIDSTPASPSSETDETQPP
jgi:hypothetical protein